MSDLDFDELDRAVNSVVNGKKTDNTVAASDEVPVVDSSADQTVKSAPDLQNVTPVTPSVPRPNSGQFMDVVHPSSDMRRSTSLPNGPLPVIDNTVSSSVEPVAEKPNIPVPNSDTYQPPQDDSDIDKISEDITNTLGQKSNEPLESPFIVGTKVEKRPLGAFSTETPTSVDAGIETETSTTESQDLSEDVTIKNIDNTDTNTDTEATLADAEHEPMEGTSSIEMPRFETAAAGEEPTGPTSITQQYKEQPSTGDQTTGAIYDTDTYHKAITKPAEKKPIWFWMLLILGLVILGAGAGAAVYFFAIPHTL